jgi:hypothetical protein
MKAHTHTHTHTHTQRCNTAEHALDKAVAEKRKAEDETNNMYEQVP